MTQLARPLTDRASAGRGARVLCEERWLAVFYKKRGDTKICGRNRAESDDHTKIEQMIPFRRRAQISRISRMLVIKDTSSFRCRAAPLDG